MNDSRHSMSNGRRRARCGVSLIEVLVVLVILVLGILIIVRLYPSGFFSINSVGDAALADSLAQAAVQSQAQGASGLPDEIRPGTLTTLTSADGDYDPDFNSIVEPDYSKTLDKARTVINETVTVPAASATTTASGTIRQSLYVVNYGPIMLGPTAAAAIHPSGDLSQLSQYLTVNSAPWTAIAGDETAAASATPSYAQETIFPHQERFMVDLTNKMIAVPYAAYSPKLPGTTFTSYPQKIVAMIVASDGNTYTQYLNVPPGTPRDAANPYAPQITTGGSLGGSQIYIPDTTSNYQGGWFNPTTTYLDSSPPPGATSKLPPANAIWQRVILYRPYQPIVSTGAFDNDPYEFMLATDNFGLSAPSTNANPGVISFNPKAAGGSGSAALKAQISYQTYTWSILHEDRDIPALPSGNTAVIRLTLKNLKRAGDPDADNTIYQGLAGGNQSLVILDLDSGQIIAPFPIANDPTNPTLNDEDLNGTTPANNVDVDKIINVSYSTGRITFPYNTFGDGATPKSHRVRIFYAGDLDWTVAVQKAPSYYIRVADVAGAADPNILPGQCAYDPATKKLYFPHSDFGKTVEVDGITAYNSAGMALSTPYSVTAAIGTETGDTLDTLGATKYWSVSAIGSGIPAGANSVSFTVRGLSARSIVTWKERDRWRVHSVDAFLNRPQ